MKLTSIAILGGLAVFIGAERLSSYRILNNPHAVREIAQYNNLGFMRKQLIDLTQIRKDPKYSGVVQESKDLDSKLEKSITDIDKRLVEITGSREFETWRVYNEDAEEIGKLSYAGLVVAVLGAISGFAGPGRKG